MRKRYIANREAILERGRARYAETREHEAERKRVYYAANKEKSAAYSRAYNKANLEKRRAARRRRRARELAAPGTHTAKDVQRQYELQRGRCHWCDVSVGDDYHVDHIIALTLGGSDGPENIVIACPSCNMSKHNRLPTEWDGNKTGRLL